MSSRSLGTLSIDLVARTGGFVQGMDKAQRESAKWRRQTQQDMRAFGTAVTRGAAIAAAGFTAMTVMTVNSVTELKNLSQVANTSTQTLQKMAFGAQRMGIDQGKLADILKDTNDRIGDFIQTGGGPMVDFFENIAPLVGVTAEQFAKLSGPDALQLFVDSLEKANLSAADMTFYMEAMSSESTKLLPLLRNGGEEMRRLGEEAERTGNVFSEMEIEQLSNVKDGINDLTAAATGMRNRITMAALPAIEDLVDLLSDPATIENAEKLGTAIVSTVGAAADAINTTVGTVRFLAEELASITVGIAADDIVRLERDAERIREVLSGGLLNNIEKIRFFGPDGIISFSSDAELEAELAKINAAIEQHYAGANKPEIPVTVTTETGGTGDPAGVSRTNTLINEQIAALQAQADALGKSERQIALAALAAEKATPKQLELADSILATIEAYEKTDAINTQIEALQLQSELLGLTAREQALYKLELEGADATQLELADSILATVEAYEKQIEAQKEAEAAMAEQSSAVKAIEDSLRTQEEMIERSYQQRRQTILDYEEATGEDQTALLMRLHEDRNEQLGDLNRGYWETYLESAQTAMESMDELVGETLNRFAGGMGDAFESMIFDAQTLEESMQSLAESMLRNIVNALGQMAAQWLAYQAVQMITARTSEAASAAAATATGTAIASAYAPAAAMVSLSTMGANSAPAMAGIAATTAMAQSMTLMGMAHDGIDSVPQDGTWLLQKGERVTTAETSAKLDGVLDRIATGQGMGRGGSNVQQTINVTGNVDRKTATQIATDTARKQRQASHRLGS